LRLLLSVPAGGRGAGHLSLVAKTQYSTVGEASIRLQWPQRIWFYLYDTLSIPIWYRSDNRQFSNM